MEITCAPLRSCENGSARIGQPVARRNDRRRRRSRPAPQPATEQATRMCAHERGEATDVGGGRLPASAATCGPRARRRSGRARRAAGHRSVRAARGTAGSGAPARRAVPTRRATARHASARHDGFGSGSPGPATGGPGSWNQRTAPPKRWVWSMVWPAPTSRSSGGRSAVHTSSGTRAWCASTTAGWKFAAAVPEVQHTIAGRPEARPMPSARNAGRALVEDDVDVHARVARQRERERRVAGARRHHRGGHSGAGPLVDQRRRERGRHIEVAHRATIPV